MTITVKPAPASATDAARPMPLPAPVTSAIRVTSRRRDSAAVLVLDVHADDLVEVRLRLEPERARAARVEAARPTRDDPHHAFVGLASNPGSDLVTRDAAQRLDLLGDGHRNTGHRQATAGAERSPVDRRGADEEADRSPGRGVPVTSVVGHRQHRFLAVQRLANDVGEEA